MLLRVDNQPKKLVIDSGSCMNVVPASTVERLKLPIEPHPHPYKVAWIDNTSIPVTQRCFVSFVSPNYSDSILCDVIPMNVTHILLGRPWLYEHTIQLNGRKNTYTFSLGKKTIVLHPMTIADMRRYGTPKPKCIAKIQNKPLHVLFKRQFVVESKESKLIYAVVVKELKQPAAGPETKRPIEVEKLLYEFSDIELEKIPSMRNVKH